VATGVLSVLMVMKGAMGLMPELNPIGMISHMLGAPMPVGWAMHFMIGIVWGIAYALIARNLPGGPVWVKGALFSVAPWLLMMIVMMPMAGAGLFGMAHGMPAPVMTLVLHLVFGAVLGLTYGARASSLNAA
jgi:uncharacterized membrane protein YagU involved in acid resistance